MDDIALVTKALRQPELLFSSIPKNLLIKGFISKFSNLEFDGVPLENYIKSEIEIWAQESQFPFEVTRLDLSITFKSVEDYLTREPFLSSCLIVRIETDRDEKYTTTFIPIDGFFNGDSIDGHRLGWLCWEIAGAILSISPLWGSLWGHSRTPGILQDADDPRRSNIRERISYIIYNKITSGLKLKKFQCAHLYGLCKSFDSPKLIDHRNFLVEHLDDVIDTYLNADWLRLPYDYADWLLDIILILETRLEARHG